MCCKTRHDNLPPSYIGHISSRQNCPQLHSPLQQRRSPTRKVPVESEGNISDGLCSLQNSQEIGKTTTEREHPIRMGFLSDKQSCGTGSCVTGWERGFLRNLHQQADRRVCGALQRGPLLLLLQDGMSQHLLSSWWYGTGKEDDPYVWGNVRGSDSST